MARSETEATANAQLEAYLMDLVRAREATLDEVKKFYGEYLAGVSKDQYLTEATKRDRLDKLLSNCDSIIMGVDSNRVKQQSAIGTNMFYYVAAAVSFLGYELGDMPDAAYYIITGRTLDGKVTIDGKTMTVKQYAKQYVKNPALRAQLLETYLAKGGASTIDLIKGLDNDIRLAVNKTIIDAIRRGDDFAVLKKALRKQFAMGAGRAERIARTEIGRGMNSAEYEAWREAKAGGLDAYRVLVSAKDDRTRAQSASMDGQREGKDGKFVYPDGRRAAYPGNSGNPAYDINDREVVRVVIAEDEEGTTNAQRFVGERRSTSQIKRTFEEWRKANGITKNRYGEYYKA